MVPTMNEMPPRSVIFRGTSMAPLLLFLSSGVDPVPLSVPISGFSELLLQLHDDDELGRRVSSGATRDPLWTEEKSQNFSIVISAINIQVNTIYLIKRNSAAEISEKILSLKRKVYWLRNSFKTARFRFLTELELSSKALTSEFWFHGLKIAVVRMIQSVKQPSLFVTLR